MTIQDLGSLGEFIASIATVATLAYLAVQIRQSNVAARAQSRQTMIDTWSSTNWDLARDPRMLKAFAAGLSSWPDISDEDKTAFDLGMGRYLANIHNGILLRAAGLLDSDDLEYVSTHMVVCVTSRGGSQWWKYTALASPQVRAYVEQRVSKGDVGMAPTDELMPHWMAMAKR